MLVLPGQTLDSTDLKQVGPTFSDETQAGLYRDWLGGGPAYRYPVGKV